MVTVKGVALAVALVILGGCAGEQEVSCSVVEVRAADREAELGGPGALTDIGLAAEAQVDTQVLRELLLLVEDNPRCFSEEYQDDVRSRWESAGG